MKILIDGQTLLTPEINRGIGTYFVNTVESILSADFVNDFFLVVPAGANLNPFSAWAREKLHLVEYSANGRNLNRDALASSYSDHINGIISQMGIDLYWTPNALMDNVLLPAREVNDCRYAATVFDLIPLVMEEHFKKSWPVKTFARYRQKLALLETDYDIFLHISHHTQADFTSRLGVSGKKHAVTPLAVADSFRPYPFPTIADAEDYVLYPGGFDPRKNMDGALEAFAELHRRHGQDDAVRQTRLRLVCHKDESSEKDIRRRAKLLGIDDKLDLTGFVTDAELIELYQKARCLFFPSLYEGFGLPVLEGLACGLPIAASNTSSIPEVGGKLALYFDPHDPSDMAEVLYRTLREPRDLAVRLHRHEHARQFSWTKTAMRTLAAWNDTAEEIPPSAEETPRPDYIDVRQRINELSVEELCGTANEFFARLDNWDYLHIKPFAAINETPELLFCFAKVVEGLKLLPDMRILDFGAGSCWTSRFLSQMGLEVIACDVSEAALEIGRNLYRRLPVIGDQPAPRFLKFDGHRFDLPDEHVDRISCLDAFHHVPNQQEVLNEMARILKPGGIVGFSEPGPQHSLAPQSQYEMRTHRVIENDIDVQEIWNEARAAGFTNMKVAFVNPNPLLLSIEDFAASLNGDGAGERYLSDAREEMRHRRLFFLYKGEATTPADSRQREGLLCELQVQTESDRITAGESLQLQVTARNSGANIWLPTNARVGAVHFGAHLFDEPGTLLNLDYFRHSLTPGVEREIPPGETVALDVEVPVPMKPGNYTLQFDLVSEGICWFEHNGCETVRLQVEALDYS